MCIRDRCGELVIVGELPDDSECAALRGLAAEFGVGVVLSLIHI